MNKLSSYSSPDRNVIFCKVLKADPAVTWLATKENNGFLIWRRHCLDTKEKRWEESEWIWEIKAFDTDRDRTIEACLVAAQEEEAKK